MTTMTVSTQSANIFPLMRGNSEKEGKSEVDSKINTTVEDLLPRITVSFDKTYLNRKDLIKEIGQIKNPQIFLWYFGPDGLREQGVNYYKKDLKGILSLKNGSQCLLYDLAAWSALFGTDSKVVKFNPNVDVINGFDVTGIRCIKSCNFFDWVQKEDNPDIISFVRDTILKRKFIFAKSESYPETGIKIGDVFPSTCQMLENILECDTGKSYSALQYIEGCYLIIKTIENYVKDKFEEINMVFALPNDEFKYYQNQEDKKDNSLVQDVQHLAKLKFGEVLSGKRINIMFFTFRFMGEGNRPYNAGIKNIEMISKLQLI